MVPPKFCCARVLAQVVRLRLRVLRRELESIGADLSGWHVCAGWRYAGARLGSDYPVAYILYTAL